MPGFLKLFEKISWLFAWLSGVLLVAMVVMILGEVISRKLFQISLPFAWEYSGYAQGIIILCGASLTLRTGTHIRVTLLKSALPESFHKLFEGIATLITTGGLGYLAWALSIIAWQSLILGRVSASVTETPLAIPQVLIALGAWMVFLQAAARFFRLIQNQPLELSLQDTWQKK